PRQLVDIKGGLLRLFEGRRRNAVMDACDHGAVGWRIVVKIARGFQSARARHIHDDDGGPSGQMRRQIPRDQPAESVINAGRSTADDETDLLASIEIVLRRPSPRTWGGKYTHERNRGTDDPRSHRSDARHFRLPDILHFQTMILIFENGGQRASMK